MLPARKFDNFQVSQVLVEDAGRWLHLPKAGWPEPEGCAAVKLRDPLAHVVLYPSMVEWAMWPACAPLCIRRSQTRTHASATPSCSLSTSQTSCRSTAATGSAWRRCLRCARSWRCRSSTRCGTGGWGLAVLQYGRVWRVVKTSCSPRKHEFEWGRKPDVCTNQCMRSGHPQPASHVFACMRACDLVTTRS